MKSRWPVVGLLFALFFATGALSAEALGISTAPITFPGTTLDGSDQLLTGSTTAWRADGTGETNGWNVAVSSSNFSDGAGHSINVSFFEIRLPDSNIVVVSGDVNGPVSTQTNFTSLSSSALKIASAAVGEGDGVYDMTPEFQLTIPAETYAGTYSATVTIAINTGP